MKYTELVKKLEKDGWYMEREGKGSHMIFKHPAKTVTLSIPYHGSKDLGKGLVSKILKQAGLK